MTIPAVYWGLGIAGAGILGLLAFTGTSSAASKTSGGGGGTGGGGGKGLPPMGEPNPGYASDPGHQWRWQIDDATGDDNMSMLAKTVTGKSELYPDLLAANKDNPAVHATTQWYHPAVTVTIAGDGGPWLGSDGKPAGKGDKISLPENWRFQDSQPGYDPDGVNRWQNRGKVLVPWDVGTTVWLPLSWNAYIDQAGIFTGTGKQYPPDPRGKEAYVAPGQKDGGNEHLPLVAGEIMALLSRHERRGPAPQVRLTGAQRAVLARTGKVITRRTAKDPWSR